MSNGHDDFGSYQAMLEAKQAELIRVLRKRDELAIEKNADQLDEVKRAAEREWAGRNLDRESRLLQNVKAALGRIAEGDFGVCVHCEGAISPKRLNAVPWAPLCLPCQEAADHHELSVLESLHSSWRMLDAA